MNKKKILHIYYNTSGNSGLYLNPIYEALKTEYEQVLFVNYYYPLEISDFKRIFFPITEKNESNKHYFIMKHNLIRKGVRFFELKKGNSQLYKAIIREKPDIINYSLTNMPDALENISKIHKLCHGIKIIVTCHDVVPFNSTNNINYKKIYEEADYLLVHTKNAISILKNNYAVPNSKIIYHKFPAINLNLLMDKNNKKIKEELPSRPTFLFIGVMRKEKGVQNLVDAWKKLGNDFNAHLIIAGYKPEDVDINFDKIANFTNVEVCSKSLSDKEYFEYVSKAQYIIFPYDKVGNSGVLSTVVSMHKVPITTLLPTFIESPYCNNSLQCESDNIDELEALIKRVTETFHNNYAFQQKQIIAAVEDEKQIFDEQVRQAYRTICEK